LIGNCADPNLGFYCPASTRRLTADIPLDTGTYTVNFSIANADALFANGGFAFNNLGGGLDPFTFDWGLPFFFGRSVYTAIKGRTAGGRPGPFLPSPTRMRPVAIVQHDADDGPAFFARWLQDQGLPWQCFAMHAGDTLPPDVRDYAACACSVAR